MLDIEKRDLRDDLVLIKISGKLIYDTEEEVNLTFDSLLEDSKNVIMDISELNYINSSGLGIFINFLKNIKSIGKRLVILNPSMEVAMLFEITSLDRMFTITSTIEDAMEQF